jgi:hypothetical protein
MFSPSFWRAHVYHSRFRPADFLNSSSEGASERLLHVLLIAFRGRFFCVRSLRATRKRFSPKKPLAGCNNNFV